jgi:hypothetical protein
MRLQVNAGFVNPEKLRKFATMPTGGTVASSREQALSALHASMTLTHCLVTINPLL